MLIQHTLGEEVKVVEQALKVKDLWAVSSGPTAALESMETVLSRLPPRVQLPSASRISSDGSAGESISSKSTFLHPPSQPVGVPDRVAGEKTQYPGLSLQGGSLLLCS